jgi:uncharacterized protein
MIFKLILLAAVIYVVYILFFREGNLIEKMKESASKTPKKSDEKDVDTVVECQKCGVYVSVDEAILKDGKYYCSKECAEVK